jgi:hypothetical protein
MKLNNVTLSLSTSLKINSAKGLQPKMEILRFAQNDRWEL